MHLAIRVTRKARQDAEKFSPPFKAPFIVHRVLACGTTAELFHPVSGVLFNGACGLCEPSRPCSSVYLTAPHRPPAPGTLLPCFPGPTPHIFPVFLFSYESGTRPLEGSSGRGGPASCADPTNTPARLSQSN
ncbi:hypothetical protein Efla_000510 [Eimeria flavescens]